MDGLAAGLAAGLGLGFAIGLSLGLLGGGGSILTVPALVYIIGQSPKAAVTTSLVIVGANSLAGALQHQAQGRLHWRVALVFGGAGMGASFLAAGLSSQWPAWVLMTAFASLMVVIGLVLLRPLQAPPDSVSAPAWWKVLAGGAAVGVLTGVLGVGGGFLVVPALVMLVGLDMHQAVGTSLVVIAMNSVAGFLGHLPGAELDPALITVFVLAGLAGTLAGARLNQRLDPALLRRVFAVFVIGLGVLLLVDNVPL